LYRAATKGVTAKPTLAIVNEAEAATAG
jgi:hypothetical protein